VALPSVRSGACLAVPCPCELSGIGAGAKTESRPRARRTRGDTGFELVAHALAAAIDRKVDFGARADKGLSPAHRHARAVDIKLVESAVRIVPGAV
jgi:hypothetical protein